MKMDEAAAIAVNCVRVVGNFHGTMQPQDQLSTLGISTTARVNGLRNRIVNDNNIGVPSVSHSLDPVFLQELSGDWTLVQLILVIYNNSVSNTERSTAVRAAEALVKLQKLERRA